MSDETLTIEDFELKEIVEVVEVSPYGGNASYIGQQGTIEAFDDNDSSQPYLIEFSGNRSLWCSKVKKTAPPRDPNEMVPYSTVTDALREFRKTIYKEGMEAKRVHGFCNEIDSLLRKLNCTPKVSNTPQPSIGSMVAHATAPQDHPIFKRREDSYGGGSRWTRTGSSEYFTWERVQEIINGGAGRPSQVAIIFDAGKMEDYTSMAEKRIVVNEEWE